MGTNYYSWLYKTTVDSSDFKGEDHSKANQGETGGQSTESNKPVENQGAVTDSL